MTKVNKMFKAITVFVAIAMLAALLPVSVAADNVVTITADDQVKATDTIVVKGNIAAGNELTILAVRHTVAIETENTTEALGILEGLADGKIMYIDQVTSNGSDHEFSFKLRNDGNASQEGNYLIVFMGGTDASAEHKCIELVNDAPTDLAFDAEASYTGNAVFTFTDVAAWRAAVAIKNGDTAIDASKIDRTEEGKLILDLEAGTYTVTFTAAGYTTVTKEITVTDKPAIPVEVTSAYSNDVKLSFTDDGVWADNVIITVNGEEVDGDVNVEDGDGVITLALETGTYNITLAVPGYTSTVLENVVVTDRPAGTASLNIPARGYYFDTEEIVLTLAGGYADWADAVKEVITVTGEGEVTAIYDASTGVITVDGVGNFTVEFDAIAGYAATEALTFEVKAYGQAVADAAIAAVTYDKNDETYLVTVPAEADLAVDFAGEYTFAWAIDPEAALAENVYTITRPATDAAEATYTLALTVTYADNEYTATRTFTVLPQGVNGPTFTAENVEVIGTNVYKMTGKSLVIVKHDEVDGENTSIVVDGVKLYYFPVRGTHVGVIDTTTVEALISGNKITTEASAPAKLYSGVAMESNGRVKPTGNDGSITARYGANLTPITPDLAAIGWKLLGTSDESKAAGYDETAWLLSCDVVGALDFATGEFKAEMDGKVVSNDAMFIRRVGANKDSKFAIDPEAQ